MVNGMDKFQPQGICQRFLKFLIDNLLMGSSSSSSSTGIKRVTLGPAAGESVEVPIETPSRNGRKNPVLKRSSKSGNGEIVIEFRHIEASNNGPSVPVPIQNGLIGNDGRTNYNGARKEGEQSKPDLPVQNVHPIPHPQSGSDIDKIAETFLETRKKVWEKALLHRAS